MKKLLFLSSHAKKDLVSMLPSLFIFVLALPYILFVWSLFIPRSFDMYFPFFILTQASAVLLPLGNLLSLHYFGPLTIALSFVPVLILVLAWLALKNLAARKLWGWKLVVCTLFLQACYTLYAQVEALRWSKESLDSVPDNYWKGTPQAAEATQKWTQWVMLDTVVLVVLGLFFLFVFFVLFQIKGYYKK